MSLQKQLTSKAKRRAAMSREITKLKNMLTFEEQEALIEHMKQIVKNR